jgi:hypothetical protein
VGFSRFLITHYVQQPDSPLQNSSLYGIGIWNGVTPAAILAVKAGKCASNSGSVKVKGCLSHVPGCQEADSFGQHCGIRGLQHESLGAAV